MAAMSAALLSLGERAAEGLGRGGLSQVHIQGESGGVWLLAAGDDAVLVGVSAADAKAGLVLYELRRATAAVSTALAADELEELAEQAARAAMQLPVRPAAPQASLPARAVRASLLSPRKIVTPANGTAATAWPASGSAGWS